MPYSTRSTSEGRRHRQPERRNRHRRHAAGPQRARRVGASPFDTPEVRIPRSSDERPLDRPDTGGPAASFGSASRQSAGLGVDESGWQEHRGFTLRASFDRLTPRSTPRAFGTSLRRATSPCSRTRAKRPSGRALPSVLTPARRDDPLPGQSGDGRSGGGRSGDGRSGDGQSDDGQSDDGRSGDGQSGDGQSGDGRSGDGRSGGGRSGDGRSDDGRSDDGRSGDGRSGRAGSRHVSAAAVTVEWK